jgi:serine phosphatase RsbU (regulator of sigma subunit)
VEEQKKVVEEKNHEILDSINYAKRIQTAILPQPRVVKEFLKSSFVLYIPKDIVAGDFYWMENIDQTVYIAACDCTGHGVPGALVSVVCNNALNRALNEYGKRLPSEIFDKTRELVIENFAKSDEEVKDGMDASLAALDVKNRTLLWSGANNPLWIIRKDSGTNEYVFEDIKADKQPIGKGYETKPFTTHQIQLNEGDTIYLFTDGYADQFGGEENKKMTKAKFRALLLSLAPLPMEKQRTALLDYHDQYRGNEDQVDDICVIGVRV